MRSPEAAFAPGAGGPPPPQMSRHVGGQPPQFVINEGQQFFGCLAVTSVHRLEQPGHFAHNATKIMGGHALGAKSGGNVNERGSEGGRRGRRRS
jgi:hypothetical protein